MNQFEATWEKLSKAAVTGAEYDSPERLPHPKCLKETRVNLLDHIYDLLDDQEMNQLIWLNGTAGVGKSAVAFTVAEKMRGLNVKEPTRERRLEGTFFFSRKYTDRCTTGSFFATLVHQLTTNFPSVKDELIAALHDDHTLLDPRKSLRKQMEALFLVPLRRLEIRLRGCPPLVFIIDALDECTSEAEIAELISLLGEALREPGLPVIHILLTSRSEAHIRKAIREEEVRPLVREIPSGKGVLISLDGADVDKDIYTFLKHSFADKQSCSPNFPQPTKDQLARLASRAGRRFIVASTMMNFIDDGYSNPCNRLQLLLKLTNKLLRGTEVYKLYDHILSTCAKPERAYMHLSVVAALANPLPISQISELLGPGQGSDVETVLVQLRSVMDIPAGSSLPVNIYHSSVRDYALNPSNCGLSVVKDQCISPHSLLAYSSFLLMMRDLPKSNGLLGALVDLKKQSKAMQSHPPQSLRQSLAFIVEPPTAMRMIIALLWLRGDRRSQLHSWLETPDGCAWLRTQEGKDWLEIPSGREWLQTSSGQEWLQTPNGRQWLQTSNGRQWLQIPSGRQWLQTLCGQEWLQTLNGRQWLQTPIGRQWLQTPGGLQWLQTPSGLQWLQTPSGPQWLETPSGLRWLQTPSGRQWLQSLSGREWLQTPSWREWLQTPRGREWLQGPSGTEWLQSLSGQWWLETPSGRQWLRIPSGQEWLETLSGREWLQTLSGQQWLQTLSGRWWLQIPSWQRWLHTPNGREWLDMLSGLQWLQTLCGRQWLETPSGQEWLETLSGREWLQSPSGREWLETPSGREWLQNQSWRQWLLTLSGREWLQSLSGREWLQSLSGQEWLETQSGRQWLRIPSGQDWLQILSGQEWLQTPSGKHWLSEQQREQTLSWQQWLETSSGRQWVETPSGQEWLETQSGQQWLETPSGRQWVETPSGQQWLEIPNGQQWLETPNGQQWLQTPSGRQWLQTSSGQQWLQTPQGQVWQSTPAASVWVHMEAFLDTVEAISKFTIVPESSLLPVFQAIELFKSLPDFLMFPAFLTSISKSPTSALAQGPDIEIIHAMEAFVSFTNKAPWEQSQSASDALMYACQNWAMHLSRAPKPWNNLNLKCIFRFFWDDHLLSWLEGQWCLGGLQSCLIVLSEGQELAKKHLHVPKSANDLNFK